MKREYEGVISTSRSESQLLPNYSFPIKVSMVITQQTHFKHDSVKNMMIKIVSGVRLCSSETCRSSTGFLRLITIVWTAYLLDKTFTFLCLPDNSIRTGTSTHISGRSYD